MSLFSGIVRIITGNVAHDAADSGNPIKIGGKASILPPTSVATGDRVDAWFDEKGSMYVNSSPGYRWAYYYGGLSGGVINNADILFQRAVTPTWPFNDDISDNTEALDYFDTDDALFNGDPIWCYIPMGMSGYRYATVMIRNVTGVNADISAFMIPDNTNLLSVGPVSANAVRYVGDVDAPHTVATSGYFYIGLGTDGDDTAANRICSSWTCGALLIRFDPASDPPGGGHWLMTVMRSR